MDIVETLKKTKIEMQTRGRTTGTLVDHQNGCVCLLGAVGYAVMGQAFTHEPYKYDLFRSDGVAVPAVDALVAQLPSHLSLLNSDYDDVSNFNDGFARSDEEVYALIDRAIEAQVA